MKRFVACIGLVGCAFFLCAAEDPFDQGWGIHPVGTLQEGTTVPVIQVARSGPAVKITFTGTLQSAVATDGPWTAVSNAASPLTINLGEVRKFYRAWNGMVDSVFSSHEVAAWTVKGPLQKHFELAFAGSPDGIFPPRREKPYFDGSVRVDGFEIPVSLRVRGNSSLQECPFPKLKMKVSKENRAGTPFFDAREIKIGTHCADGGRGNIGRLRDERAAFREALAYEVMEAVGFVTPRVRRVRIEYHDTTPTTNSPTAGWVLTRSGMILDDVEVVAERSGGRALSDEEIAALKGNEFEEQLLTDLQFFHALLGNWDYGLSLNGEGLWNTEVIEVANGKLIPVAGDFDLASWVTGEVRISAPREYHPELGDVERQAQYQIEQIQKRVSAASFLASSNRFSLKRSAIENRVSVGKVDAEGATNAVRHVKAFYDALGSTKR